MNINRHNYEEFFLMYVDNELSQAERAEVEAFVEQNQDLQSELELLKDAVMLPDENVQFANKDSLYKNERSINLTNCEEYFLLYIDNELTTEEKDEVEKFVLQNPTLQQEFTLLQQSKLKPEVIQFKNKVLLYRTEAKVRRIVPVAWMRVASAAALIGIVALLWFINADDKMTVNPIASADIKKEISQPKTSITIDAEAKKQIPGEYEIKQEIAVVKKKTQAQRQTKVNARTKDYQQSQPLDDGNLNQIPSPEQNQVIALHQQRGKEVITNANVTGRLAEVHTPSTTDYATNSSKSSTADLAKHAVYKELDNEDEDKTIFIAGAEINKNKLRGLFKRATTLIEKRLRKTDGNTSDDDNIIQVASFEIKTK